MPSFSTVLRRISQVNRLSNLLPPAPATVRVCSRSHARRRVGCANPWFRASKTASSKTASSKNRQRTANPTQTPPPNLPGLVDSAGGARLAGGLDPRAAEGVLAGPGWGAVRGAVGGAAGGCAGGLFTSRAYLARPHARMCEKALDGLMGARLGTWERPSMH